MVPYKYELLEHPLHSLQGFPFDQNFDMILIILKWSYPD